MQSEEGRRLAAAKPADAAALLELSPTALLFGAWHSQGEGGGIGAKFPRTLVSEIMGIDTPVEEVPNQRTGVKDPVMAMVWAQEPEPKQFEALDAVAHDIGYIGHSASLVRCRFMRGGADAQNHPATQARRRIYPGRLAELERAHRTNPIRPVISPGSAVPTDPPSSPPALSPDWLVLETIGGAVPNIRATALVCRCRGLAGPVRRAQAAIRDLEAGVVGSDPAPCRSPRLGGRAHLMTANAIYRLDGLESDNLLAFLALLGLLRALEESRPTWYPRAFWTVDAPPIRPSLCIREPVSEKAVVAAAAEGLGSRAKALHLAPFMRLDELKKIEKTRKKEKLSLSCEEDAELRKLSALQDLKLPPEDAAERLEDAAHGDSSGADLWASLIVDAAVRSDGLAERTPLSLLSGQGHQHFLSRLALVPQQATPPPRGVGRGKKEISEADCLREALFMPWTRPDATFSFARGGFRPENS